MKSARQLPQYEEYQYKAKTSFFSFKNSKVRIVKSRAGRGRRSSESLGCHTAVLDTQPQFLVFSFQFTRLGSSGHDQSRRFVSSVRSSSGYHGLIEIRNPLFQIFSNSSDSKVKVKVKGPNMCYIFEKHGIQGYRI